MTTEEMIGGCGCEFCRDYKDDMNCGNWLESIINQKKMKNEKMTIGEVLSKATEGCNPIMTIWRIGKDNREDYEREDILRVDWLRKRHFEKYDDNVSMNLKQAKHFIARYNHTILSRCKSEETLMLICENHYFDNVGASIKEEMKAIETIKN